MIKYITNKYLQFSVLLFSLPLIANASGLKESITSQIDTSRIFLGDPVSEFDSPRSGVVFIIGYIIQFILVLVGIYFFASIIYGGYMWMTAAGNDEQVGKAKKILTRAFVGFLIVLFALGFTFMIMSVVVGQTMVL